MMVTRIAAPAALVLGLASLPAPAQDWRAGTGRLEGRVLDVAGKPLGGAVVRLELQGRGGTELRTDARGRWAILGLTGGNWVVELSAPGYVTRRTTLAVAEETRRPVYEVRLEKLADPGPPPEVVAVLERAEAARKGGRLAAAREEYETLRTMRPDLAGRIDQEIGMTYVAEKDYARGLDHLLKALAAEPDRVPLRAAAVQAAFEAGQAAKGKELLAGVDSGNIEDPDIAFNFGIDLVNAGDTRGAIPWFTRAVGLDARYVDGYYRRGLAHLQLGEAAESLADFRKVTELAPGTPEGELARKALERVR
ncbi:MAG TPA: tetratricopeptide repeat protein [Vicinamibacteria bacterium]|nr:tetratricopeptide repeat protein [Vicinamibacteria bacterium]